MYEALALGPGLRTRRSLVHFHPLSDGVVPHAGPGVRTEDLQEVLLLHRFQHLGAVVAAQFGLFSVFGPASEDEAATVLEGALPIEGKLVAAVAAASNQIQVIRVFENGRDFLT